MRMPSNIEITFEIEPIVKLVCLNTGCRFNLVNFAESQQVCCQLKNVVIGQDGKCVYQEPVKKAEQG